MRSSSPPIRAVARIGVVEICVLLRIAGHPVSLNMAYGLQADLMGSTWNRLPTWRSRTLPTPTIPSL